MNGRRIAWVLVGLGLACLGWSNGNPALGQGLIIDRRPRVPITRSYEIREVIIDAQVRDQVAEVRVSQTFHNPGSTEIESEFLFPLPEDGAIQNFVLQVDGKELPGRLINKDEARRIYEEIVRSKRDPALLEYMGKGLFRTSVFPIPPGADRKVTMRYTQLCKRDRDVVEFSYPLSTQKFTAKPIQRLAINTTLRNKEPIKSIYCPSDDARIDRVGDLEARVSLERRDVIPTSDFRLVYTLAQGSLGASVLSYRPSQGEDGYFLLLASPEVRAPESKPLPKTVIFVIDRSGSMAGKKIEQARNALKSVLNNLRDDDLFNIVVYDDRVESFKPELERFSSRSREEAERFVENLREGGSTNIDAALKAALNQIKDDSRPSYVLFLTDGLPTTGETQELKLAENCRAANTKRARIFCFGLGFDVNARLLDRISGGNSGTSEYVKPDENLETHVGRFYAKMTSPVLTDLKIEIAGTDLNRTYPRDLPDLFEGGQIIWVGRYRQAARTTLKITGKIAGESRSFEFPVELAEVGANSTHDYVERIWATRRVGYLIDQIDLLGQNKELIDELVALSTQYGILTPYTSFLADERVPLHAAMENRERASEALTDLSTTSGGFGVLQRDMKQAYMKSDRGAVADGASMMGGMAEMAKAMRGVGGAGGMSGKPASQVGRMRAGSTGPYAPVVSRHQAGQQPDQAGQQPDQAVMLHEAEAKDNAAPGKPSVKQIGSKTFYFKEGRWVDSSVKAEEEAGAKTIRQFSDEFFALARGQSAERNQYLTFEEPLTIKLDGTVYRIELAEKQP